MILEVRASLAHPGGEGLFPAVIFVAGSGPTDRNWNSPLIPGTNGSGALLAHALTEKGFITLRYDKRASGPERLENTQRLAGKISLQGHVEELAGGVNLLANHPQVDPAHIFVLTNSEGCFAINTRPDDQPSLYGRGAHFRICFDLPESYFAVKSLPGRAVQSKLLLAAYDAAIGSRRA
jgi:hypothetical protein